MTRRALPADLIDAKRTALLVIDMERDFVDEGAVMRTPRGLAIVPVINRLSAWARERRLPVIFTHEMHRADTSDYGIELEYDPIHCVEGTEGCKLTRDLVTAPGDYRLRHKRRYDSFMGTELELFLRARDIENLICCGVTTHVCVMNTVMTARNLDFRAFVPEDAVAAVNDDFQRAALLCMSTVFAYVTTAEELIATLGH